MVLTGNKSRLRAWLVGKSYSFYDLKYYFYADFIFYETE